MTIKDLIYDETRQSPNLFVYMTHTNVGGLVGLAWIGSACVNSSQIEYRSSITAFIGQDDLLTAEILAHEIGHNLNMRHDFEDIRGPDDKDVRVCPTDGSSCTDVNGIMDYFELRPLSWTCCSR